MSENKFLNIDYETPAGAADVVIKKIQDMILKGELKEGDRLPPERDLIKIFSIGRPTLREALRALQILGLIETRHGSGNYVTNKVTQSYFAPLSLSFVLSHGSNSEIRDMRYCLETFSISFSAQNATDEDVEELDEICSKMEQSNDIEEKAFFDRCFHNKLFEMAQNKLLLSTYQSTAFLMETFSYKSLLASFSDGDSIENIYREHRAILQAVKAHDAAAAKTAMERHLSNINLSVFEEE